MYQHNITKKKLLRIQKIPMSINKPMSQHSLKTAALHVS